MRIFRIKEPQSKFCTNNGAPGGGAYLAGHWEFRVRIPVKAVIIFFVLISMKLVVLEFSRNLPIYFISQYICINIVFIINIPQYIFKYAQKENIVSGSSNYIIKL